MIVFTVLCNDIKLLYCILLIGHTRIWKVDYLESEDKTGKYFVIKGHQTHFRNRANYNCINHIKAVEYEEIINCK